MKEEEVLSFPAKILDQAQREFYFDQGYLIVESLLSETWLEKLRSVTTTVTENSRSIGVSDQVWDLEPGHNSDSPRLRRLTSPNDYAEEYWEYATSILLLDVVEDLVGPDVKFHHSKLNFKWARGGEEVKWHQDIQFWPHTNYSPLTIGTYLYDCDLDQGPLLVRPKSHKGELFNQFNDDGKWSGHVHSADHARLDKYPIRALPGPAGSITIHNCRTLHASQKNNTDNGRPLLLNAYSSADAMPYTPVPTPSRHYQKILRGTPARWAHHDPRPCQVPPDWSGGYDSIFSYQQAETT